MHRNPYVICIGEAVFDRFFIQLDDPQKSILFWKEFPGGAPANTACALVKLEIPTAFVGCVGQDKRGRLLAKFLENSGIDCRGLQQHLVAPTRAVNLIYRGARRKPKFDGFNGSDPEEFADSFLQAEQIPNSLFDHLKFLVLGTLELAYSSSRDAIYKAINLAKFYRAEIFIDVNWAPMFWKDLSYAQKVVREVIRQATFLKLTDDEAGFLFGTITPSAIIKLFPNLKGVLVTANERGCHYSLEGHEDRIPAFPANVIDPTGAGDAFNAGIIYKLCQYGVQILKNPKISKRIVTYASAVGALTTEGWGATTSQPSVIEVRSFLARYTS